MDRIGNCPGNLECLAFKYTRASTGDGYSPGYIAFTSRALLASRWSIVSEKFVLSCQHLILQHSHTSHPVALCAQHYLPCGFCQDHRLVVWLQAQSDRLSRRRGGEVVLTRCLKKDTSKCALKSLFCLLVQCF